ncbi:MAG: DUF177 domain-containing protein [Actinomycetota bacterium]
MSVGGNETTRRDGEAAARPAKLLINVADLRRRLGQRRVEPIEVVLPRQTVVASSTTDGPVVGEVTVESIERGVSVHGHVRFGWEGECRRCLELTGGDLEVEIDEIFQVGAPDDSDLLPLDGDQIDLVPLVREAVVLSLPLAPLCREDCPGPDPDRYPARTEFDLAEEAASAADGDGPPRDPRWAALDQLQLGEN